ncbi:Putative Cytochrome c family protein [Candidatus Sulfobium mesophilum]|uniref:Cytochrome c family protein n=1 Tax=Candidatus Sulfobium mesophilum TaxID=2016548 RepID=A0A2U3QE48_9BACT|nr:Putative Cytochrome c family protein [Candidatus Sulfobium mesophilum]
MKKAVILILVSTLALTLFVGVAFALIPNSAHDLSGGGFANGGLGINACQYCHTPHQANNRDNIINGVQVDMSSVPLWNRSLPTTVYNLYNSGGNPPGAWKTLSGTTVTPPGAHSLTCLSCHDGTIGYRDVLLGGDAIGTYLANHPDPNPANYMPPSGVGSRGYIGTDLRNTHPVGVVYNDIAHNANSVAGLSNVSAALNGLTNIYTVGAGAKYRIYGGTIGTGRVECGSCHDPHGDDYQHGGANAPYLRGAKADMCTDCHSRK